jgi:large conductance mechanosensitive channel
MLKGFRDFIFRGNVIDLAVAVIIGTAFNAIVASLVKDVLTPLIAAIVGKPDFSALVLNLHGGHITYGVFLNNLISFLMVASVVYFCIVLPIHKLTERAKALKPSDPPPTPTTKICPECLSEIPILAKRCSHCTQPVV